MVESEAADKRQTEETLRHNAELEEANIDKTVADSFPASDPASSVPEVPESPRERGDDEKAA